jgi:hypothetical protein
MLSVERAINALPAALASHLTAEEVYVADLPGVEVVAEGVDPRAPMLFDGALPGTPSAPAEGERGMRLFVYQRNVERMAGSVELLEPELCSTLERELNNALGLGEGQNADASTPATSLGSKPRTESEAD